MKYTGTMKTFKKIIIGTIGPLIFFVTLFLLKYGLFQIATIRHSVVGYCFALVFSLVIACAAFVFFSNWVEGDDYLD